MKLNRFDPSSPGPCPCLPSYRAPWHLGEEVIDRWPRSVSREIRIALGRHDPVQLVTKAQHLDGLGWQLFNEERE